MRIGEQIKNLSKNCGINTRTGGKLSGCFYSSGK